MLLRDEEALQKVYTPPDNLSRQFSDKDPHHQILIYNLHRIRQRPHKLPASSSCTLQ